jgi:hypothetical protein
VIHESAREYAIRRISEACAEWYEKRGGFSPKLEVLPRWQQAIVKETVSLQLVFEHDMEIRFNIYRGGP